MTDPIKAKIQSLCPDVMELKFGCEIEGPWGRATILSKAREFLKEEKKYIGQRYHILKGRTASTLNHIAIKEILGSPITLAVVLRAIEKAEVSNVCVDMEGRLDTDELGSSHWNLEHDNYDAQSQETKDFIGKLLNV